MSRSPARSLCALVLSLLATTGLASAQEVTDIVQDVAGLGEVVRVLGTGLEAKSKLVLVQDGAPVKKTKLKVDAVGDGFVDVLVTKAFAGHFRIGVQVKKDVVSTSPDELELVPPQPESVEPDSAQPGDEVVVTVRHLGSGGHKLLVGDRKAKILDESVVEGGDAPLTLVTIVVPPVADGSWPVSVVNRLGTGALKDALEVGGGTGKPGKLGGSISIVGAKPFKPKQKLIGTDEGGGDPGEVNVGLVGGSKKRPVVFGITMPGQLDDLSPGDTFDGDDATAAILYTVTNKDGSLCVWTTEANEEGEDFAIQVIAVDEDQLVLFVCGKARLAEELSAGDCSMDVLCFSGMVTAPGSPDDGGGGATGECSPLTTATGSSTGEFVSSAQRNEALYGLAGPNLLLLTSGSAAETGGGTPLQVIEMRVTFNPATDATPATFNSLALDGSGLQGFTLTLADLDFWYTTYAPVIPPTPASMSVTITEVEPVGNNPFGILGCIHGTFTGTLTEATPDMPTQSFSGSFEIPWYDPGFGT